MDSRSWSIPRISSLTREHWASAVQTGKPYRMEHRLRRHDGVYRWHLSCGVPALDREGHVLQWCGTSTDIHELRLRESEERFREIADTAPVIVWITGADGLHTFFNRQAVTFTGRKSRRSPRQLLDGSDTSGRSGSRLSRTRGGIAGRPRLSTRATAPPRRSDLPVDAEHGYCPLGKRRLRRPCGNHRRHHGPQAEPGRNHRHPEARKPRCAGGRYRARLQ